MPECDSDAGPRAVGVEATHDGSLHDRLTVVPATRESLGHVRETIAAMTEGPHSLTVTETDLRGDRHVDLEVPTHGDLIDLIDRIESTFHRHRRAKDAADGAAADLIGAQASHEAASRRRSEAQEQLDRARRRLATLSASMLSEQQLQSQLDDARRRLAQARTDASEADASLGRARAVAESRTERAAARIDELHDERSRLIERVRSGTDGGAHQVSRALNRYRAGISSAHDPKALSLADELTTIDEEIAALQLDRPRPVSDVALAMAEQDLAEATRRRDEIRASLPAANEADRARMESLHAEVESATAAEASRPGFSAARERMVRARRAEREALEELGFSTYSEYMLTAGTGDPGAQLKLWSADRALREAAEHVQRLRQTREGDPRLAEAIARRELLLDAARDLLGCDPGENVDALLRSHPRVSEAATKALARALVEAGVDTAGSSLAETATAWLRRDGALGASAEQRMARLAQLDAELATAEDELVAERTAASRDVDAAQDEVHGRREALSRHRSRIEALEAALAQRCASPVDLEAAEAARDELDQHIGRLENALAADSRRHDEELAQARERHAAAARDCAAAQRALAELLEAAEPGGGRRDPMTVLSRLRARTDGVSRSSLPVRVAEVVRHVHGLLDRSKFASTIVLDLPMTAEERVSADCFTALADLAREVRLVWITTRPEVIAWASTLAMETGAVLRTSATEDQQATQDDEGSGRVR